MNRTATRLVRITGALLALVTIGWILTLHAARPYEHGLPTDWSHRHVIFSQPQTAEQVALVAHDPRYWQQFMRRNMVRVLATGEDGSNPDRTPAYAIGDSPSASSDDGLWSQSMGSGATVGAGNFPIKYSFSLTTATCSNAAKPDFVIFNTGLLSSTTKASIIAYDNLYSGCSSFGTVPTVYWAYNTTEQTVAGTIKTSPIISLDGTQVAFVQTDSTAHGYVILLKWKANNGTLAAPVAPNYSTPAQYASCATLPCMTAFTLRTTATGVGAQTNDTTSSIFYDYTSDIAYVGDSLGLLHQYHPFFSGTPAEVGSPWPVQVNAANPTALSSPLYDHVSKNIFVGDAGGYIESISSSGSPTVSAQIDHGAGISNEGPTLDQVAQKLYAFSSNDGSTNCGGNGCAAVYQFATTFTSGSSGTETQVGASSATPNFLYSGDFDNAYLTSHTATGNLYVCGDTGANPIMYQIPISAGTMPAAGTSMNTVTTAASTASCSEVTDISNPNAAGGLEERIFFSPQGNGRPTPCGGKGCVESFIVTPWKATTAYATGYEILSPKVHIEVVIVPGTSAASPPTWSNTAGVTRSDGGVTWLDQGVITAVPLAGWTASKAYALRARILDSNNAVEISTTAGTSAGTVPLWPSTPGATVIDGSVVWINAGPWTVNGLQATKGASGIIIDNVVGSGTMAGASQVYFSTLGNQTCTTGGTGGCAMQASQAGLQ